MTESGQARLADWTGGFHSGAVRFAARALGRASICHCRMSQRPCFSSLQALPPLSSAEEERARLFSQIVSYQHPDHDTAVWPLQEDTP